MIRFPIKASSLALPLVLKTRPPPIGRGAKAKLFEQGVGGAGPVPSIGGECFLKQAETQIRWRGRPGKTFFFQFTMLNKGETVECTISGAAMDELSGKRGTLPAEREAQFLLLREAIERIASDKFDSETPVTGGVVPFFAKDIRSAPPASS